MKASTSFVLRTLVVVGLSVRLGLAFNSSRPDSLPMVGTRPAPAPVAPAPQDSPAPTPAAPSADAAPAENASAAQPAPAQTSQEAGSSQTAIPADEGNASLNLTPADNATVPPTEGGQTAPAPAGGEISLQDAAVLFAAGQAVFVDAREAQTYAEGHVQGALSLPLFSFAQEFPALRGRLEGRTIITYCDGERCSLSSDLAEALRAQGLANVYELRNGWTLWQEQGLPTATGHTSETGGGQS